MGVLERVNAAVAKRNSPAPSQRDMSLNIDEWSALFEFGGLTYPLIQTTMGNVKEERIVGSTIAAHHGNTAVFALVQARMQAFSQIRFQWTRFKGSDPGDLFGSPDLSVLEHPWPGGLTSNLLARMEIDNSIAGNAYIVRPRGDRLARLRPDLVTIILGSQLDADFPMDAEDVEVAGYAYWPRSGRAKFFLPEEVAHYASQPDPNFQFLGMSWLTSCIREVQADSLAVEHKARFFQNAATPNLAIKFDPTIPIDMVTKFKALMEEEHKGAFNAYKTLYLGGGADPVTVGKDFQQLDFAATQGKGESRLAAAAGVPPSWVGFSEGLQGSSLNAGNFNSARRRFSDGTMYHLWMSACAALESVMQVPPGANLWFDARVPFMREDAQDIAAVAQSQASTITTLVREGFEPDSVIQAVANNDMSLLKHTGLLSVQLQPPGMAAPSEPQQPGLPKLAKSRPVVDLVEVSRGKVKPGGSDHVEISTAHLLETVSHDLAHARRHLGHLRDSNTPDNIEFNQDHLGNHLESAADHAQRLANHLRKHYPAEGEELVKLEAAHPADTNSDPVVIKQKRHIPVTVSSNGNRRAIGGPDEH
jgi:phage portal protein BeeE